MSPVEIGCTAQSGIHVHADNRKTMRPRVADVMRWKHRRKLSKKLLARLPGAESR
jgi:hypothetical protein